MWPGMTPARFGTRTATGILDGASRVLVGAPAIFDGGECLHSSPASSLASCSVRRDWRREMRPSIARLAGTLVKVAAATAVAADAAK